MIKMLNNKIAVEQIGKSSKKNEGMFVLPEVTDSLGVIKFVPEGCDLKVGSKVYYGNKREQIRMQGIDVQVMDKENIIAIVEEFPNDKKTEE